ncbi:MAG: pili assembly chaperone [Candidatus Korobacteraceae bacterium]|jgi:type II secretory pathway pseudopilin PulG
MRKKTGFTVVEVPVGVLLVLLLLAIVVPKISQSRIAASEAYAVSAMRTINNAERMFAATYPSAGYSATLSALGGTNCETPTPASACLVDSSISEASEPAHPLAGYFFTYKLTSSSMNTVGYTLRATPVKRGVTGVKNYYSDTTTVIRYSAGAPASRADPEIQ